MGTSESLLSFYVKFCEQQIRKQLARGGEFLFEHPWSAETWNDSCVVPLKRKYGVRRVDMCAYGLKCPDTKCPIRKATGLMLSCKPEDRHVALRTCEGCPKHRPVEGKLKGGRSVSEYVAEYTPEFVQSMLDLMLTERRCHSDEWVNLVECEGAECLAADQVAEQPDADAAMSVADPAKIQGALKKLHANLGHPSNKDLVRILQHSKASPEAIRLARDFSCPVCASHHQPASALPAKRRPEFGNSMRR